MLRSHKDSDQAPTTFKDLTLPTSKNLAQKQHYLNDKMRENGLKQVSNIVKGSCAFKRGQMTLTIEDTVFMKY